MMVKFFKSLKSKVLDFGLKFLSIDEKLAYIIFKTQSNHIRPIALLPTTSTTLKKLLTRLENHDKMGNIHNGKFNGVAVSVLQTGVGNPQVAMVMEALKRSPCKIAIRVDYCGGLSTSDKELDIADVIIPDEVVLSDGTASSYLQVYSKSLQNLPMTSYPVKIDDFHDFLLYPSFQDKYWGIKLESTLKKTIWDSFSHNSFNFTVASGKLWSVDALFCENDPAIQTWISYGANAVDMESSAVYFLGRLFTIASFSILGISDLPNTKDWNFQKTNKIHVKYESIIDNTLEVLECVLPNIENKV